MGIVLVEPAIVPDVFCSGLADAEDLGDGNFRFTLYAKQKSFQSAEGGFDYVIVARIIMPAVAALQGIDTTLKAMGIACCEMRHSVRLAH